MIKSIVKIIISENIKYHSLYKICWFEVIHRTIYNKRFKRNNIYWLTDNADNLFNLDCTILNGDFDEFWQHQNSFNNSWFELNNSA
jgi:hypothetical protein